MSTIVKSGYIFEEDIFYPIVDNLIIQFCLFFVNHYFLQKITRVKNLILQGFTGKFYNFTYPCKIRVKFKPALRKGFGEKLQIYTKLHT